MIRTAHKGDNKTQEFPMQGQRTPKFSNMMEIFHYFNHDGVCMDLDVCQRSMHV